MNLFLSHSLDVHILFYIYDFLIKGSPYDYEINTLTRVVMTKNKRAHKKCMCKTCMFRVTIWTEGQ